MVDEPAESNAPPTLSQEQVAAILGPLTPQLMAGFQSVTGDPLGLVLGRHFHQLMNILRLTIVCQKPVMEAESSAEVLRAALVYAHASLEEAIRDVAKRRIDLWSPELLDSVPLVVRNRRKTKFKVSDLLPFADKTVRETIETAVSEWLNARSFTSLGKIMSFLKKIGIDVKRVLTANREVFGSNPINHLRSASQLIERRHKIVHSQDYEHGSYTRGSIDYLSVMTMLIGVWCIVAIVIIEEMRRHPNWRRALKALLNVFHLTSSSYATADSGLSRALAAIATGKCWPFLNEDDVGAADQVVTADPPNHATPDQSVQPSTQQSGETLGVKLQTAPKAEEPAI